MITSSRIDFSQKLFYSELMTNSTVYSTTSGERTASFEALSPELRYELGLPTDEDSRDEDFYHDLSDYDHYYYMNEWCFVCSRPTDHRGEHDDLVDQGLASYDDTYPMVHRITIVS